MSNIDWDNAPEGAEFAGTTTRLQKAVFYRDVRPGTYQFSYHDLGGLWDEQEGEPICTPLIPRPVNKWDGEELPSVGTELEAGFACEDFERWHKGICVAVGEDPEGREEFCVVQFGNKLAMYTMEGKRMRPIRTTEQIAADERLHEVRNALSAIHAGQQQFPSDLVRGNIIAATVEAMIDAGYRKQVTQ